ncbi:MAG: hypothetical protein ACJASL_005150 [Paraglaciecola sp.]|jgi:hypothetical protein
MSKSPVITGLFYLQELGLGKLKIAKIKKGHFQIS